MPKAFALALALSLAPQLSLAAAPVVPATMSYQGVLLDAGGQPQTGNVDLTFRIFDALSAGTLLYKQSLTNVPLVDGVFAVTLGPNGLATDTPANPLTTSFSSAVAGDLAATGTTRFLELTVGASGALARTQILAVPYALEAAHALSATHADTAEVANEALAVNGLSSEALTEVFEHFNFDGGPPNNDPLEGLGDVDGDGIANFVDPDNDNDGISDANEVTAGSGVNLITPIVSDIQPPSALWSSEPLLSVTGANFEAGLTAELGDEMPAPQGLSASAFQLALAEPHPKGQNTLRVTRLNGEVGARTITFTADQAHALSVGNRLTLGALGAQQGIVGMNQGSTRARFDSDGDGLLDTQLGSNNVDADAVAFTPTGLRAKLTDLGETSPTGVALFVDANSNNVFTSNEGIQIHALGSLSAPTLAFRPAGNAVAAYFYTNGSTNAAIVSHDRDNDGAIGGGNEIFILAAANPGPTPIADMDVDAAGHVAFAFFNSTTGELRLARDRSGDGDYGDTLSGNPESATLVTDAGTRCAGVSYDDAGILAVVYGTGSSPPTLGRDLDGDGDFSGAGESVALGTEPALACDVAGGGTPGFSVLVESDDGLTLYVDRDADGDFDGAGENRLIGLATAGPYAPIGVTRSETGRTIVATRADLFLDVAP